MDTLSAILSVAVKLPSIVVLVIGLVLATVRRDRLPRSARVLLRAGVVVLLVVALAALAWSLISINLPTSDWIREGGYQRISMLALLFDGLISVGYPLGFGLLIGAVLAGRRSASDPGCQEAWLGSGSSAGSVSESRRVASRQPSA
ncbi:hypothetical protein ACNAW0_16930 [Micromonospora sp. SL1-18]|uniref:hypothetical protein n=1 Tax=Micromonospora sp. SL1-18 TaxID=3399128 RepID=UPI003A4E00F9